MDTLYGADALSVLFGPHNPDDSNSLLGWFELRPDGLYVLEKPEVDDATVDAITGDYARRRKAGLPLLSIPFSSGQLIQFEAAYGGLFSSLLEAGDETSALVEDIRGRSSAAAELAEVLLGLRAPQGAPEVAIASSGLSPVPDELQVKKTALIKELENEWPSIRRDLSESTRNGLGTKAHGTAHGMWFVERARKWAVSKGKIETASAPARWPAQTLTHRIKD